MFTPKLGMVLLFVESPQESCEFYKKLLQREPLEASPTFCLFQFDNGIQLGCWSRHTAEPKVVATPSTAEICFSADEIDKAFEVMKKENIPMLQDITDMDFGRTFVARDPDGHRIRIYRLH
ncbi:MAG: VOC family protein [Verrucomicrobia bacterium]|nr:VOC family protein [Verrucomicrobiota bacterium]MBS0637216.1 VOC family protein [Verrucomicrobiota bacterium]